MEIGNVTEPDVKSIARSLHAFIDQTSIDNHLKTTEVKDNIFNDKDLRKLAPDYSSTGSMLRMQIRRSMVKDTHSHGLLRLHNASTVQKKSIKRLQYDNKINHEMVKLKNSFYNTNLKNKIMFKNAIKYADNIDTNNFKSIDEELYRKLKIETDPLLDQLLHDTTELVINNDSSFKIEEKSNKQSSDSESTGDKVVTNINKLEYKEESSQNVLRIDCTLFTSLRSDDYETEDNLGFDQETEIDRKVEDLQSLLTMMAISPNADEKAGINDEYSGKAPKPRIDDGTGSQEVIQKSVIKQLQTGITEFINVTPIRIQLNDKQMLIVKKYVAKWKYHVAKKRDYMSKQRQQTLNNFFEKLAMKKKIVSTPPSDLANKAKILAKDGMYQHRYKVQKHIIALQKAKLEEQNRLIEELKYNKIVEASKQSVDALKEEVLKSYYETDRNLKPKLKCLTNDLHIQIEEPSLVLQCFKVPQFLQRMEKRAREREEKHAIIRERRRQMEEERLRLKQQAELAKAEMDKEEKMKIIKELREKRKKEKIENIRKKQYAERMRALNVMADLHYEKYLKTKYGIKPLRMLLQMKCDDIEQAREHYKFQLKKNAFLNWMWHAEDMWFERNFKAEEFYRKKLLKKAFQSMKENTHDYVLKKQVAEDYYDFYVIRLAFRKFREGINVLRKEDKEKLMKAVHFYESDLLFKVFTCWRTLPALNAIKREQEARKEKWRRKVLQVVPDYTPPDD